VNKLNGSKLIVVAFLFFVATTIVAAAQTFKTLVSFDETNGQYPQLMSFLQSTDGNFYGTTLEGGSAGAGTIVKLDSDGDLTVFHSFAGPDGAGPLGGLIQAIDGHFYGTTSAGGTGNLGTVFRIDERGQLTTIYSFSASGGYIPDGPLIQASNGHFYGTASRGGVNNNDCYTFSTAGCGTIFEISSAGKLTTLYSFCADGTCDDGFDPASGLIQSSKGDFYGTTSEVGNVFCPPACGTIFRITPNGKLTTLYSFCAKQNCTDGGYPSELIQAADGNFYGTTAQGGNSNSNCVTTCGTVFKITPKGKLTTLYSFCAQANCADGAIPLVGLVQATDGNFYGTTSAGGAAFECANANYFGCGTIFKITPAGRLTTLYTFCADGTCNDGEFPYDGLVQATSGIFFGTTAYGGTSDACNLSCGTVFSLGVGLGPFVETRPASGKVGAAVTILGTNLKGATSVTFNGTTAMFTVVSKSEIKTTVPVGASSGTVKVTTTTKTLKSNVAFLVP
jgi:uncharacterized repeat protein (TIGR03803 family)